VQLKVDISEHERATPRQTKRSLGVPESRPIVTPASRPASRPPSGGSGGGIVASGPSSNIAASKRNTLASGRDGASSTGGEGSQAARTKANAHETTRIARD
jgi:hypothetical protein